MFYTKEFETQIEGIEDKKGLKKIISWLDRLACRTPDKPYMWQKIKGCKDINLYELKPRPYRIAVLVVNGRFCLCLYIWKVEKDTSCKKRREIEKAIKTARRHKNEFEKFVRKIQDRPRVHS